MESSKRQKVGHISEEDVSNLLHKYSAQKVLTLLQEVSQSADVKMDWNALVKNTATGITSAREYQMLWRHIAYFEELLEKVDYGAEPLDDDSDLEYELEAYPAVSAETSAEAAACVKVLISSGLPGDSKVPNSSTVEAPLTIKISNGQSSKSSLKNSPPASVQGTNIMVPVSVQKQPVPQGSVQKQSVPAGAAGEGPDTNGSTCTIPSHRRKRKPWTEDEDLELKAAVDKCGEGNWQNVLKGDFKGDRTASQLSQRWAIIKKRIGAATSSNPGTFNSSNEDNAIANNIPSQRHQSQSNLAGGNPISSKPGTSSAVPNPRAPPKKAPLKPLLSSDSSTVRSEKVLADVVATRLVLNIALKDSLLTVGNGAAATSSNPGTINSSKEDNAVVNSTLSQPQPQSNPVGGNPISSKPGTSSSVPNARAPPQKVPLKPVFKSDDSDSSMVTKAAVAAGARLGSPSKAASLFKAAQSKNAVHLMPKVGSTPSSHLGPNQTIPFARPPVRANLVRPTTPSLTSSVPISHATGSQPVRRTFVRPVVLPAPSLKASTLSTLPNKLSAPSSQASQVASSQMNATPCLPNNVELKKEEKNSEVMKAPPPPPSHPLARPVLLQNAVAQPNPSPVSSSAKLECSVNTEKEKAGIATAVVDAAKQE